MRKRLWLLEYQGPLSSVCRQNFGVCYNLQGPVEDGIVGVHEALDLAGTGSHCKEFEG